MNQEFCQIVGLVAAYLERYPDGAERLKVFLEDRKDELWSMQDVMRYMGRGRTYLSNLINTGQIPYIPGRPHRFIPKEVKAACEAMQTAPALFGRRKFKSKRR